MKYYKGVKLDFPPYLEFECVAKSVEELQRRGLTVSEESVKPVEGVVSENSIPVTLYGVCVMDMDADGKLFQRASEEMDKAREVELEGKKKERIIECQEYLKETDWVVTKCLELGLTIQGNYPEIAQKRIEARETINHIEESLGGV
ncbi:hypothetical protein FUAX_40680 (plasmid) [Fulvitalea axinellae]|uniref:Uncharacterized protein n=1 Tax=Fulvitalea axinellae TaxID=1182444 RepID=A0AAU9CZF6_9BACT|nr:hypothetical protein FUAX_32840 [Fulvitalea axinellae]BDD11636.1 hypothetical protein FUAX_40680 [Fulvitalea axinellae]